eukprot:1157828-Pelagomonas_calceolata.AAC.1
MQARRISAIPCAMICNWKIERELHFHGVMPQCAPRNAWTAAHTCTPFTQRTAIMRASPPAQAGPHAMNHCWAAFTESCGHGHGHGRE